MQTSMATMNKTSQALQPLAGDSGFSMVSARHLDGFKPTAQRRSSHKAGLGSLFSGVGLLRLANELHLW